MRALFILFIFFHSGSWVVSAQSASLNTTQQISNEGTWQIQVVNSRNHPYIPANIDELVANNRHDTEIVYVQLGTQVRLKILPFSEINRQDFLRIEKIIHITE